MAQKVTIEVTNVSRYRNICIGNATSGVRGLRPDSRIAAGDGMQCLGHENQQSFCVARHI